MTDITDYMEDDSTTKNNILRAEYILNHYAKTDIIALARDLDRRDKKVRQEQKEKDAKIAEEHLTHHSQGSDCARVIAMAIRES